MQCARKFKIFVRNKSFWGRGEGSGIGGEKKITERIDFKGCMLYAIFTSLLFQLRLLLNSAAIERSRIRLMIMDNVKVK